MIIDIYQLWLTLSSNLNVKQGGHLRVRDFNNWVNSISLQLFKEKFVAWEKNQAIVDDMSRPFLVSKNIATSKTVLNHALLSYPSDYAFFSSARIFVNNGKVIKCSAADKNALADSCEVTATIVKNDAWGSVCNHELMPPTLDKVYITQYEGGFKVAPKEIGFLTLDYLRFPKKAKLVFLDPKAQTYDATNSKPLEWSDTVSNEFLNRLELAYYKFVRELGMHGVATQDKEAII